MAGIHLNAFNNHADRVRMANLARTINVLQAMILTRGEQMILTPTANRCGRDSNASCTGRQWGAIRLVDLTQLPDRTVISAWNAKLNWQASPNTHVSGFWFRAEKEEYGRTGWGGVAADSYRWDQRNASESGGLPPGLWKLQADHTFSPKLFVSARAAHHDSGFGLYARGSQAQSFTRDYALGEAIGTNSDYVALRPDTTAARDGNGFFEALGGHHELSFGLGYEVLGQQVRLGRAGFALSVELFNVFNSGVVLLRDGNAHAESFDRIDEIISPRILRLGVRLTF